MIRYQESLVGLGTEGVDEVVLSASGGPYGGEFTQASNEAEVAEYAEDETVEERDCTPGREY